MYRTNLGRAGNHGDGGMTRVQTIHLSIDDDECGIQVGRNDAAFDYSSFIDALEPLLSPIEQSVFKHLMTANPTEIVESANEPSDAFLKAYHLTNYQFSETRLRIIRKCRAILASSRCG